MIKGIVGNGSDKFTVLGQFRARFIINWILNPPDKLCSGHSIMVGIDIWAEQIAKMKGCYDERLIFEPMLESELYYRIRNNNIAQSSNQLHIIVAKQYPKEYTGKRFEICYHHKDEFRFTHVKSGACWTGNMFRQIHHKEPVYHVVDNY